MAKFMYLYHGPATDMADMSEEQSKAIMEKWGVWMGRVGDALVDAGAPTAQGVAADSEKVNCGWIEDET